VDIRPYVPGFELPSVVYALSAMLLVLAYVVAVLEIRHVAAVRAAARRLTLVGRAAMDVIYEWDIRSGALAVSSAAAAQLGYDRTGELQRVWWEERLHPEDSGPVRDALATLLRTTGRKRTRSEEWEMEYRFRKADGTFTTVHDHGYVQWSTGRRKKPVRMVGTLVNVDSVSLYDPVTGLAGRALFTDRVERRAVKGAISGEAFSVVVLDVDGLREVSDRLGQSRASAFLNELARRLETHLGDGETVARIGPDQLAFLVNAATAEDATARAAQIRDSARIPFTAEGDIRFDVHAGAAVLPQGGSPDLMRQAVAALADAKRSNRRVAVYEPGGDKRWEERVRLRDELRGALERKELCLDYQPIAETGTGRCVAVEAFIRWDHPTKGMLDAGGLLQVATDLDLVAEIDRWVLYEATRAVSKLRQVRSELGLSVNIAVRSLDAEFPTSLRALLAAAMLPGDALTIELPEDDALRSEPAVAAIAELRALGVDIAIDDFGTGYASLLPEPPIPATVVKIDRVFAGRVANDEHATRVVRSAVQRARELGLKIVGEGVEDKATIAALRKLDVDLVQGRGVASPMSLQAVTKWLETGIAPADAAALRTAALRPTMIGENEAPFAPAGEPAVFGTFGAPAQDLITDFVPTDLFALPATGDPMGWVVAGTPAEGEPDFSSERAHAFAPSYVPPVMAAVSFAPEIVPLPAAEPEPVAPKKSDLSARLVRRLAKIEAATPAPVVPEVAEPEPVAAVVTEPLVAEVTEREPVAAAVTLDDPRVVALRPATLDPRLAALLHRRHEEQADRLDERIVLLREHAVRQAAGSIAS
jgi:diguanylate cyclase (GGDEF)-like protein